MVSWFLAGVGWHGVGSSIWSIFRLGRVLGTYFGLWARLDRDLRISTPRVYLYLYLYYSTFEDGDVS